MTVRQDEHLVGPVLRGAGGEIVDAIIAAIERDNADRDVRIDDQGGYVRISVPRRCVLRRDTLQDELGSTIALSEVEPVLSSFAGRLRITDDAMEWYLERDGGQ